MGYFRSQDIRLLLFLNNRLHLKGLKAFMRAYTHLGGVAFHSCLAIFLLFAERPLGVTFLINIFVSQFLVHSLKFLVHRPRPYATYESVIVRKESRDTNAFPSAHTASSLMAAFTFSKAFPELAWLFYPLAILVGFHGSSWDTIIPAMFWPACSSQASRISSSISWISAISAESENIFKKLLTPSDRCSIIFTEAEEKLLEQLNTCLV